MARVEYNVFSATLSYSREHVYVYSVGKTEEDFMRCLLTVYRRIGGITEKFKRTICLLSYPSRAVNVKFIPRSLLFLKILVSSWNSARSVLPRQRENVKVPIDFINWIRAFDYKVKSEKELIYIIEEYIAAQCNREINQTTNLPPVTLFQKEIR